MRIRRNSEYAKRYYLKEVCIVNQNPWDILGPLIESQSQNNGENDDFCGLATFGKTVKDLLSEIQAEEGKDRAENKPVVHCSFTDASGINCGVEAKADSKYCDVHLPLPRNTSTRSGTRGKKGVKKVVINRLLKRKRKTEDFRPSKRKRKMEDLIPGEEIVYYAGFPGLRRKRGCPTLRSEAAAINVDE